MSNLGPGEFISNGFLSKDFEIFCSGRPEIKTPVRRKSVVSPYGSNGDLIYDHMSYDNTPIDLDLWMKGDNDGDEVVNRRIADQLFPQDGYFEMIFWFDPETTYEVYVVDPPSYTSKRDWYGTISFTVSLSCKPFKRLNIDTEPIVSVENNFVLPRNPSFYAALPSIKLEGRGVIGIKIGNGQEFKFKDIKDHVYIDSELFFTYTDELSVYNSAGHLTTSKEYPYIPASSKGEIVRFTGEVSKVSILPRWRTLV